MTEILIHPQLGTLKQCMRNLLASFSRHRHVIHAGYTLSGTGSWILQVTNQSINRQKKKELSRTTAAAKEATVHAIILIIIRVCVCVMTILQDGVYELSDMLDVVQEPEVQRLLRAYDSITVDLHCTEEGQWVADRFNQLSAIKSAKVQVAIQLIIIHFSSALTAL